MKPYFIKSIASLQFKLFLCSREIEVGDMVSSELTDGTHFCIATEEHLASNKRKDNNNRYFKIIKETPHSMRLKDGDEFDKNEINFFLMEKYYTSEQISKEYTALSKDKKIAVLYSAIDYMQQYNGRTRFLCIALAMGYDNIEGKSNTYIKRIY